MFGQLRLLIRVTQHCLLQHLLQSSGSLQTNTKFKVTKILKMIVVPQEIQEETVLYIQRCLPCAPRHAQLKDEINLS